MMAGGKKHLGYGCGYVEDIRGAEHSRERNGRKRGTAPDGEAMRKTERANV